MDRNSLCYLGRKSCGCAVAFAIADPCCADDVAEMIRNGYTVHLVDQSIVPAALMELCTHDGRQVHP